MRSLVRSDSLPSLLCTVMPGGIGTMDETFEIMVHHQLANHNKPIGFLNTNGFFDFIFEWIRVAVREGMIIIIIIVDFQVSCKTLFLILYW